MGASNPDVGFRLLSYLIHCSSVAPGPHLSQTVAPSALLGLQRTRTGHEPGRPVSRPQSPGPWAYICGRSLGRRSAGYQESKSRAAWREGLHPKALAPPPGYLGPCWYRQSGGYICLLLLGVDRIMLTFPSAPLPLAQGKLRVGGVPRTGQNARGGLFGGPACWVGVEAGETW